ncbi:hypothetical protein M0R04_06825 [Candidatus Dojkabacteria bacterium]|jgi:hypothetical protein|nr:hypothetical protein [Candidatus Dojkabacteria bacterium]
MTEVTYAHEKSKTHHHIEWIDLAGDGILHECAIMKRDAYNNVLFFKTNDLDEIDKKRLAGILMDRNADKFELFDLCAQKTLGNGMNALAYFHQITRQLTANGRIIDPRSGQMGGVTTGQVNTAKPIVE